MAGRIKNKHLPFLCCEGIPLRKAGERGASGLYELKKRSAHLFFEQFVGRRRIYILDNSSLTHQKLGFRCMAGFEMLTIPI